MVKMNKVSNKSKIAWTKCKCGSFIKPEYSKCYTCYTNNIQLTQEFETEEYNKTKLENAIKNITVKSPGF